MDPPFRTVVVIISIRAFRAAGDHLHGTFPSGRRGRRGGQQRSRFLSRHERLLDGRRMRIDGKGGHAADRRSRQQGKEQSGRSELHSGKQWIAGYRLIMGSLCGLRVERVLECVGDNRASGQIGNNNHERWTMRSGIVNSNHQPICRTHSHSHSLMWVPKDPRLDDPRVEKDPRLDDPRVASAIGNSTRKLIFSSFLSLIQFATALVLFGERGKSSRNEFARHAKANHTKRSTNNCPCLSYHNHDDDE